MTPTKILSLADDSGNDVLVARAAFIRKRLEELEELLSTNKEVVAVEKRLAETQAELAALRGTMPQKRAPYGSKKEKWEEQKQRRAELEKVRDWAHANGHYIKSRGRIPEDIWAMYEKAKKTDLSLA